MSIAVPLNSSGDSCPENIDLRNPRRLKPCPLSGALLDAGERQQKYGIQVKNIGAKFYITSVKQYCCMFLGVHIRVT
jgi:hypothetical protein